MAWMDPTAAPDQEKFVGCVSNELGRGEIHVWRARLDVPPARFGALLSEDERARASRYRFAHLRRRFTVARGLLRVILGRYLDRPPESLRFRYSEHGKPSLAEPAALRFNVAHTEDVALYAVAWERPVGVDVERVRPMPDMARLVAQFFSARERAALEALPEPQRLPAFFRCWTRKEAYMKARGLGFSLPLDQFDVSLAPGEPAALLEDRSGRAGPALPWHLAGVPPWHLAGVPPWPDHAAALAYQATDTLRILYWRSKYCT